MVTTVLYNIFTGRNYWRTAPFAELAELYAARFLRMVAHSIVGVMVAVFLYQKGYSLVEIMLFIGVYYVLRSIVSYLFAYYVAWVGPKRATLMSNLLAIPSFIALTTIDQQTTLSVIVYFFFSALSVSLYSIAADTQFSSVKHDHKVGHEISWLHIVEKVATGVSPLIGGVIAYLFGPESTMWIAAVLSILAAFPLFMTPERIRRKQRVMYQGLPWRAIRTQLVAGSAAGADQVASGVTWSIFVSVVIFGTATNAVYAKLGAVMSVSIIVSIVASHLYGKIIDRNSGPALFRAGVVVNSILHILRPFVATPVSVVLMNATNEVGTSAYQMPYMRSFYDEADSLPGYRVAYISMFMIVFCAGAAAFSFMTAGAIWLLGTENGLSLSFIVAALYTLVLLRSGYGSLRVGN